MAIIKPSFSSKLYFELYTAGSKTNLSYEVYLDSSSDAVENSYSINEVLYESKTLTGTNGFSALTKDVYPLTTECYRIRILSGTTPYFVSAWFKPSTMGYANYIPYYGTNGPSNGLYRIAVASDSIPTSKIMSGTTEIYGIPSIKKKINCNMYVFWGEGHYLSGGTKYPPIIGVTNFNIGDTYRMILPTSVAGTGFNNTIQYKAYEYNPELPQCSYDNSYGLDAGGLSVIVPRNAVYSLNLTFRPRENVICTGRMAEAISYYAKEFDDNQCIPKSTLISQGFNSTETNGCLPRFNTVKKNYSIIFNTVFVTSGAVGNMKYVFSGDSTYTTETTPTFPEAGAVAGCWWKARIADFLGATYSNADLDNSVTVTIGGAVLAERFGWYYKVVASDRTVIKSTSRLSSDNTFTTTMDKLDGATVFFSKSSNITSSHWPGAEKATDGARNITSTTYVYSWNGNTTTSLNSIGEFDYE